jgi:hypothetical protein
MASNPIYQQNGNHANGKAGGQHATATANGTIPRSSSSHFMISPNQMSNGKIEPKPPTPNGYRVAPSKIPTKAEIDYHLENFIMSRKIALNGGNELRIDDKNISLHLNNNNHNNPYAASPYAQQQQQLQQKIFMQQHQQQQFPNNLHFSETINETTLAAPSAVDQSRPKRPHSIAVSSPINLNTSLNNDLNVATLTRRQKITTPNIVTGGMMNKITTTAAGEQKMNPQYCSPINFSHFNGNGNTASPGRMQAPFRSLKSEFALYTPPSPVAVSEANGLQQKQPPNVPQRRSQSIPRQAMTQSFATSNGQPLSGSQTLNRPRSLDRYSNVGVRTTNAHSSPHNPHIGALKQSITFHGQQMLNQACYQSDIYEEVGQHMKQQQKKDRPASFAYGTVPEQVYLENQLRMYQEQLKNITESMKKYQEQSRILNELKRQQTLERQKSSVPSSKSDSKLSSSLKLSSTTSLNTISDEVQTPSHQLRLFLDNIRNSIKEPSFENDVSDHETEGGGAPSTETTKVVNKSEEKINAQQTKPNNVEAKTPSDQLRLFLDAIRHNQSIETHQRTDVPKAIPEAPEENFEMKRSETFSQVTDNIKLLNQDLESFNDNSNITSISKNMDQILDDFNRMASLLKKNNSVDYLQKCSDALKQTTEQLRQLNGSSYSSDDSSCSTTPGSIREAVQNLMSQPRNGFQIMDDRMSIFIDIMEQQGRFSQVNSTTANEREIFI